MKINTLHSNKVIQTLLRKAGETGRVLSMLALLLAITFAAKANPVDVNEARQVGATFLNANVPTRGNITTLDHVITYSTSDNTPAFYVFNAYKSFVIVAADDCATPILGYSTSGQFDPDNLPVQLQDYLQDFVNEIQYAYDRHMIGNSTTAQQWSMVRITGKVNLNRDTQSVAPLLTDSWGQGCYYNNHCPEDTAGYCGRVVTGCVATSMSEIMRYWGHPVQGNGSHSYTPEGYPTQTANFGATTYDWANMPNSLNDNSTTAQVEAISTLVWHCGVAVEMMYGAHGSGAYSEDVVTALKNYFDYSQSAHSIYRNNMSDEAWLTAIKGNLDLGKPVHHSGSNSEGGHAFVCDGYDENDFLHFNFGWYGSSNGYFAVGAVLGEDGYNNYNHAIIDIVPNCQAGTYYQVNVSASPSEGGGIMGAGTYECGSGCTLTATPNDGYTFCSWTENGAIVSTNPTYSFTVMDDRTFEANFMVSDGDECTLVFTFNDSYGDGWNGNYLVVNYSEGCFTSENLTLEEGTTGTVVRNVPSGSHVILSWYMGQYTDECSFSVGYQNSEAFYSASNLSSGFSYEFDVNCDSGSGGENDDVTIGDPTSTTTNANLPGNSLYEYAISQQIYTADEIGTAGTINSLTMWLKNASSYARNYNIYMKEVTDATFESNTAWVSMTDSDLVATATLNNGISDPTETTFTLSTPFEYSGNGNLVICFSDVTGNWGNGVAGVVMDASGNQALYAFRDASAYDVAAPGVNGTLLATKNVVKLNITTGGGGGGGENELTVYDGTATSSYVPVYGFYGDAYLRCQFVMPAADLADMNGGEISQMDFYMSTPAAVAWTGIYQVYMTEVADATISDFINSADATTVYNGTLDATGETMTVVFNNNYTYNGGNLLIGFDQTTTGNYNSVSFYGVEATGASVQGHNYSALSSVSATQRNFIPKTTFSYSVGGNETLESNLDYTTYDWQTNSGAITRTITWPDGKVNFAYTMASDATSYSDRGTGIGTYDSNTDEWIPSGGRVESEKTGFGSIARYGNNSIVVAAHTASRCGVYLVQDKDNIYPGCAALLSYLDSSQSPSWPNVMTSGSNRNIIHVIATSSANNKLYYYRSSNGGLSWDKQNVILPYLTEEYGSGWGSNVAYWMETTEDNCLALVVNNGWSDGMVIYSYDNGETWQRKVFYHHPGINTSFENWFLFPRWTSAQWGPDGELRLAYEFNSKSGEPGSGIYFKEVGGVAFWSESLLYHGETAPEWGSDPTNPMPLIPGQPFIMDSAYIFRDIYSSWWLWSNASHDMWPEYFGYLSTLDDNGNWEDPYESTSFNIADRSLHGSYNNGCVGMPVLCKVPGTNALVAVWCAMDENHTDVYGNYYLKLFASYSNDGGHNWSNMVHLTKDAVYNNMECVYPQATIVDNKLVVACQMDGVAGTFVQLDDDDPSDNHYQGMVFNLEDLFGAIGNDDIVTIGSGTDSQFQLPVQSDWLYSLSEQIYTAEEIGRAGRISTIGFKYDYDQPFNVQASFALKHVTKEFFEASNDMVNLSDDDFVYSGTFSATAPGWVTLVLDTPFEYDGTSNLLVACYKTEEITYESNYKFKCTYYEDGSRALGYYSSSIIPDYTDLAGYGGWKQPYNYRNDIQLGFGEVPIVLSAPQVWIDFDYMLEYEENYLNWNMPNEDVLSYNIYQDDILVASTTDTYYDLTNLTYNLDGYRFNVTAVYAEGESYYSNSVYVYVTGKGTIAGHVYEQDGVTPVQGAMVRFDGTGELGGYYWYYWYPGEEGYYSFEMPVGVYTGYAIAPGYQQTYYVGDIVISHNETTTIDFVMDEAFYSVAEVTAEYYPDANDDESDAVKISWTWGEAQEGWHTYLESEFNNAYRSNVGTSSWGYEYPVNMMSLYAGYSLTKVALFSDDYYGAVGGNYTCNVYLGGVTPDNATLVSSITVDVPVGLGEWVEYDLTAPVAIDGTQPLWIIWTANETAGLGYPAGCSNHSSEYGDWWNNGQDGWYHLMSSTWTMRNYFSGNGRDVVLNPNDIIVDYNFGFGTHADAMSDATNETECVNPNAQSARSGDRSLQYYRVYRTDEFNEGPFTEENTVLVADNVTDTYYIDESWAEAPTGSYKYGVSCVYEGNRESAISWIEPTQNKAAAMSIIAESTTGQVIKHRIAPQKNHGNNRDLVTLLEEGFEDGMMPEGWTSEGGTQTWSIGSGTGHSSHTGAANGDYNATCYIGSYSGDAYLITPPMDLGNVEWATLEFNYWNPSWSGDINELTIYYRVGGGDWIELANDANAYESWTYYSIDLDGLYDNYQIAFHCNSNWGYGMGIDDVTVTANSEPLPIQVERESEIVWSNIMEKGTMLTDGDVNITVTLNDGRSPAGTVVNFYNQDDVTQMNHPMAEVVLDETGYYAWESFRKGNYYLEVYREGYYYIWEQVSIYEPTDLEYMLEEITQYVSNLYVSSTGWAMWNGLGDNMNNLNREYEGTYIWLFDNDGNELFSDEVTTNYYQLPVDDLVEGETYSCLVGNEYTTTLAQTWVDWVYQSCDNYEGVTYSESSATDEGNLITWEYPETERAIGVRADNNLSTNAQLLCFDVASEGYPAGVDAGTAEEGPYYSCLYSAPNPAWYYLRIADPGDMEIYMYSEPQVDIDFCCWGPFDDPVSPCPYGLTSDKVVSCSYSASANEYCYIPDAQSGEYYILVLTNYSNQESLFYFQQVSGTGSASCIEEGQMSALLYRDGELLGLTSGNEYLDEGVTDEHEYSIRVVYGGSKICPDENIYFSMSCPQIVGDAPATYQITASVSPEDAGTVEGAGLYTEGAQCTLVATANDGYTFSNWTKDGTIVSNNPTFAFTVTEDAAYVANFSSSGNYWEVDENAYANTMSVIGVIVIDGEEQFRTDLEVGVFCGDECRGTQRPTDEYFEYFSHYLMFLTVHGNTNDELTFRVYDHSLNQELELECLTATTFIADETLGEPGEPFEIAFSSNIEITQACNFGQGWNWWSSYVVADDLMAQMKTGLGADGKQIKSQSKFTMNYGTMWMGQLNSLENDQTYMIQANNACSVELTGAPVNPADYPITLTTGWKWIGYPCTESMSVSEALAGITPSAGDQIKAQGNFATYYNNIGWMGSLRTLTPGAGYMYKLNGTSQTLVFPNGGRGELAENVTAEGNHWTPEVHAYPSNMTVMAVVELEGTELRSENYELAAFANGEVRGSAKLMYVEPLDRYFAFLTIAGDEAAELRFGLYDGLDEYLDSDDFIAYATDAIVGTPDAPMVVRFRGTTGLSDLERNLHVYPNPANGGERFSVSVPAGNNVRVEVVNALGVVVETYQGTSAPTSVTAPMTAGVYTLRITVDGKGTYSRKLVVK